jgi:hypothetical protein
MWLGFGSVDGIWQRPFLWLVGWISSAFPGEEDEHGFKRRRFRLAWLSLICPLKF